MEPAMPSLAVVRVHDRSAAVARGACQGDVGRAIRSDCSACGSHKFCQPLDAGGELDGMVTHRVRVRKGGILVHAGDAQTTLYVVRSGSCKSVATTAGGQEHLTGYAMSGDFVGLEALSAGRHDATVTALEDSEFCAIGVERLESASRNDPRVQRALHALLAREIGRERRASLMLGAMRAEQRLAAFLLDLADRYAARGYSSTAFVLRMTREEIGSHLGLQLETVSRLFSRFHRDGQIRVQGREVRILDRAALARLVDASMH
jgi:CRP/FNR family transcriptional regulator